MTKLLVDLKLGERAVIKDFTDTEVALELLEMGCLPGTEVAISELAPLGGALAIKLLESKLAMSNYEASKILVVSEAIQA